MLIGIQVMNSNLYKRVARRKDRTPSDGDRIAAELELIDFADRSGIDTIWASKHHFSPYMTTPNCANTSPMSLDGNAQIRGNLRDNFHAYADWSHG